GEAIHHLAPGPEAVTARATMFGQTRKPALEGMAVEIGHPRNERRDADIARSGADTALDGRDQRSGDFDGDILGHSARQKGLCRMDAHGDLSGGRIEKLDSLDIEYVYTF